MTAKKFFQIIILLVVGMNNQNYCQGESKMNEFIAALVASSPDIERNKESDLFDQFIGKWDFDWIGYNEDGSITKVEGGEWIFQWILEGRVIQDIWIVPGRKLRNNKPEGEYGTTLRFYDRQLKIWKIIWIGPVKNGLKILTARKTEKEIIISDDNTKEVFRNWIFSDISENSFRWREEISKDNGKNWKLTQEFYPKRTNN